MSSSARATMVEIIEEEVTEPEGLEGLDSPFFLMLTPRN
jgi:hypothetical protein